MSAGETKAQIEQSCVELEDKAVPNLSEAALIIQTQRRLLLQALDGSSREELRGRLLELGFVFDELERHIAKVLSVVVDFRVYSERVL